MNGLGVLAVGTIVVLALLLWRAHRDLALEQAYADHLLDELDAQVAMLDAQRRHPSTSHLRVVR